MFVNLILFATQILAQPKQQADTSQIRGGWNYQYNTADITSDTLPPYHGDFRFSDGFQAISRYRNGKIEILKTFSTNTDFSFFGSKCFKYNPITSCGDKMCQFDLLVCDDGKNLWEVYSDMTIHYFNTNAEK